MNKVYSPACDNNKQPILGILAQEFSGTQHVLEIGSGTGQHAVHFAKYLPRLSWQTSDLLANHLGINQWLSEANLANLYPPLTLDLSQPWPIEASDGIFTANTLHIVSWPLVINFFAGVSEHLASGGKLCIYGPFNYNGEFTSHSNKDFDGWLKSRDPHSGIRDIEAVLQLADSAGLTLTNDYQMPANNRLLAFNKN